MSNFRIGGFTRNRAYPEMQSLYAGIIIPQVLFIKNEPERRRLGISAVNRRKSNSRIVNESFRDINLRNSKVDLGSNTRQRIRNNIVPAPDILFGLKVALEKQNNASIISDLNEIPDLGRLLAGNFIDKNSYESNIWIQSIPNPVISFDLYYFLNASTNSGSKVSSLLVVENMYFKLVQNFLATQKPANRPNAKTSDRITLKSTKLSVSDTNGGNLNSTSLGSTLLGKTYKLTPDNFLGFNNIRLNAGSAFGDFDGSITPSVSDSSDYYNTLLNKYREGNDSINLLKTEKIFSLQQSVNNNTNLNQAYILPNKFFLKEYINLIFLTLVAELKLEISNFDSKQYIIYDLLLGAIYFAIKNNIPFVESLDILPNKFSIQGRGEEQIVNLNNSLYNLFKDNNSSEISYKKYINRSPFRVNNAGFKRTSRQLSDLYTEILQKEYVKELLSLIIKSVTYVRQLSPDEFSATQDGNRIAINLKRDLFNL